jgi:hypothetical protein
MAQRKTTFKQLKECCGYHVYSKVFCRERCYYHDDIRPCSASACYFWKRLEEIKPSGGRSAGLVESIPQTHST